jgi:phosphoglycolate phosphatase-like HAD superfamily hydrolase
MEQFSNAWQAVFFDFDGVIADSTAVKAWAFAALFAPFGPTVQKEVVRYHLDNGGMPRLEKIRHCYTVIAGQPLDELVLKRLGQSFAAMVRDEVVAAPFMPGALTTLQHLQQAKVPCFVVSGTPAQEMRDIVQRKGLAAYFAEVHGSPEVKAAIIADILKRYAFFTDQCLFIGDALADYRAARDTGLHFLGIVPQGKHSIFAEGVTTSPSVQLP